MKRRPHLRNVIAWAAISCLASPLYAQDYDDLGTFTTQEAIDAAVAINTLPNIVSHALLSQGATLLTNEPTTPEVIVTDKEIIITKCHDTVDPNNPEQTITICFTIRIKRENGNVDIEVRGLNGGPHNFQLICNGSGICRLNYGILTLCRSEPLPNGGVRWDCTGPLLNLLRELGLLNSQFPKGLEYYFERMGDGILRLCWEVDGEGIPTCRPLDSLDPNILTPLRDVNWPWLPRLPEGECKPCPTPAPSPPTTPEPTPPPPPPTPPWNNLPWCCRD